MMRARFAGRAALPAAGLVALLALTVTPAPAAAQTCDPCGPGAVCNPMASTKLRLRKLDLGAGNQRVLFRGRLALSSVVPLDPITTGIRLVLTDGTGATMLDAEVPGGALDGGSGRGWTVSGGGSGWVYHDREGAVAGMKRIVLRRRSDTIFVAVFGQDIATATPETPIVATVVLTPTDASPLQCAEVTYDDTACGFRNSGGKLICKG